MRAVSLQLQRTLDNGKVVKPRKGKHKLEIEVNDKGEITWCDFDFVLVSKEFTKLAYTDRTKVHTLSKK